MTQEDKKPNNTRPMTLREKIIMRLNAGFDLSIPVDTTWVCRQRKYRDIGGFSWCLNCVENIGSSEPASTVLRWRKWVISNDGEIFEWVPQYVHRYGDFVEVID